MSQRQDTYKGERLGEPGVVFDYQRQPIKLGEGDTPGEALTQAGELAAFDGGTISRDLIQVIRVIAPEVVSAALQAVQTVMGCPDPGHSSQGIAREEGDAEGWGELNQQRIKVPDCRGVWMCIECRLQEMVQGPIPNRVETGGDSKGLSEAWSPGKIGSSETLQKKGGKGQGLAVL